MSHAYGQVKFQDGTVKHFEYNGTSDYAIPKLYNIKKEVSINWRTFPKSRCSCGKDEKVEIMTLYGDGFWWEGRACKFCMTITAGFEPDIDNFHDGIPEWAIKS